MGKRNALRMAVDSSVRHFAGHRIFNVAKKIAELVWGDTITTKSHYAQGDDVIACVQRKMFAERIVHVYGKLGYKVHPAKTFLSRNRSGFLRRSYETDGITGYGFRTSVTLRFRNPIIAPPVKKTHILYARLTLWHLCGLRKNDPAICGAMALEDAEQMGIDKTTAATFFLTPSSVGGGGVDPQSRFSVAFHRYR